MRCAKQHLDPLTLTPRRPRSRSWRCRAQRLGRSRKLNAGPSERASSDNNAAYSDAPAQWIELTRALRLQGRNAEAKAAAKVLRKLSPAFTRDAFYEIAKRFYGKRFVGPVKADYRTLCSTLQRAIWAVVGRDRLGNCWRRDRYLSMFPGFAASFNEPCHWCIGRPSIDPEMMIRMLVVGGMSFIWARHHVCSWY